MNRLGIAIKSTLMGSGEPYKINGGNWDSKVVDIRDVLRHVPSLATDPSRSVVFFSFSDTGCYVTVARCYPNREGDNIAGWIFIPADLLISGDEIARTVASMREIIFRTELPDQATMERLFGRTYPYKATTPLYTPSPKNGVFAKKDITPDVSPATIFNFLYQPYYADFQAIFVEERPNEITDVTNLSSLPLNNLAAVFPPNEEIMRQQGVEVHFAKNGEAFTQPLMAPVGSVIKIRASRKGFESFTFPIKVEAEGTQFVVPTYNWTRKITNADFIVLDPMGRRLHSGFTILINNQPLGEALYLSEQELGRARIKIKYQGQTNNVDADLLELPLTISTAGGAGKVSKGVEWTVRLADGSKGKVTVEGPEVKSYVSPLKGYEVDDDRLVYKNKVWIQRLIGFLGALVLGGIAVGILAICGVFSSGQKDPMKDLADKANQVEAVKEPAPRTAEEQAAAEETERKAIAYLDSVAQWKRDEMEANEKLKGLFDDLNNFNFEKINDFWAKRFNGSTRFMEIVETVEQVDPKNKPEGTYNAEGDNIINVDNYIKLLSKGRTPVTVPITEAVDPEPNPEKESTQENTETKPAEPQASNKNSLQNQATPTVRKNSGSKDNSTPKTPQSSNIGINID